MSQRFGRTLCCQWFPLELHISKAALEPCTLHPAGWPDFTDLRPCIMGITQIIPNILMEGPYFPTCKTNYVVISNCLHWLSILMASDWELFKMRILSLFLLGCCLVSAPGRQCRPKLLLLGYLQWSLAMRYLVQECTNCTGSKTWADGE